MGFLMLGVLLFGRPVGKGHSKLGRLECLNGMHIGDLYDVQLRAFRNHSLLGCISLDDGASFLSLDVKPIRSAVGWQSESVIAGRQCCVSPLSLKRKCKLTFVYILRVPASRQSSQRKSSHAYLRK